MDMRGKILEAFLNSIKAGIRAEKGKMRCPDMRGNEYNLWTTLQCNL